MVPTHSCLVKKAVTWLRNSAVVAQSFEADQWTTRSLCGVVLSEMTSTAGETPDAIGWAMGGSWSILIECKVSRADFLKDCREKRFRTSPETGMGTYRYLMVPPGIVKPAELWPGWGLLVVEGKKIEIVKAATYQSEINHRAETRLLFSAVRKLKTHDNQAYRIHVNSEIQGAECF